MSSESKINEINDHFKIPIFYNESKVELNKNSIARKNSFVSMLFILRA